MHGKSAQISRYLGKWLATVLCLVLPGMVIAAGGVSHPLTLESVDPAKALLVMGGSFSPPTEMHLALMADTLYEHDFPHGTFLVANPYKAGAAPAEIPLELTRVAVETFDYILSRRNIPYRDFRVLGPGRVTWISKAGRAVVLEVSSFDIDHKVANTVDSINHFLEEVGHPRNLWWLSGGDSGASMPKWGDWWPEMFLHSNMIFIGRKSSAGEPSIDHTKSDPLRTLFPEEFLSNYHYQFENGIHQYAAANRERPSIFVLNKSTLAYSSTRVRSSLLTEEQGDAELMLSPSVYRAIVEKGYYGTARTYLTRKNIEALLAEELRTIQDQTISSPLYSKLITDLVVEISRSQNLTPASPTQARESSLPALAVLGQNPAQSRLDASLIELRNQLLLGDPRYLVSRVQVRNGFALSPHQTVTYNLVRSRLSHDVPLEIRRQDDRRNRWHDLNISTNELRGVLGNQSLANELELSARQESGVFANLLISAAQLNNTSRLRFELFAGRRYFTRLAMGAVRPEFESELRSTEKTLNQDAREFMRSVRDVLRPGQLEIIAQALGDAYLVARVESLEPELLRSDAFWTEFLNLAITDYPGEQADFASARVRKKIALRLKILTQLLPGISGFNPSLLGSQNLFDESKDEGIKNLAVLSVLKKYLAALPHSFVVSSENRPRPELVFLSTKTGLASPDQNLVRSMHFFFTEASRTLESIRETFEGLGQSVPDHLRERRGASLAKISELHTALNNLERTWLKKKHAYPLEGIDADLPGYLEALEKYKIIQSDFAAAIDECRAVNHVAMGMMNDLRDAMKTTPSSPESKTASRELLWYEIIGDALHKYVVSNPKGVLGSDAREALGRVKTIPFAELEHLKLLDTLSRVLNGNHAAAREVFSWLHQKYGFLNEVVLRPLTEHETTPYAGSRNQKVNFRERDATLPPLFNPNAQSSISDLPSYIARKWGGLKNIARPERVMFSELGSFDTIQALKLRGFNEFFQVNSSYAMRGSKTLLAFQPGRADPVVLFHSFIGEDLLQHKLMQLAVDFGEDFKKVRLLTSDGMKSWDRAKVVVSDAVKALPQIPIDDLVLGYGETIRIELKKNPHIQHLFTTKLGDFAEVELYSITGKNGIPRNVMVVTDIAYRYFGKSVLPLIQPFLARGVDRVIFAGSAGVLDRKVPQHGLVVPRTFALLEDSGELTPPIDLANDFYDLAPFGVVNSGRHVSVPSPLVESKSLIQSLRDHHHTLSLDVEGAQIAKFISDFNSEQGAQVRFASAYIATDVPTTEENSDISYGLHQPDFIGKKEAKSRYYSLLNLLWDIPTKMAPSAHTTLIAQFYREQIDLLAKSQDGVRLNEVMAELELRLKAVRMLSKQGGRVSRGLVRVYGDLLAHARKQKVTNSPLQSGNTDETPVQTPRLTPNFERAILIQSVTRSSTISSGDAVYTRGKVSEEQTRTASLVGAARAIDWIFKKRDQALTQVDIQELHSLITRGVLRDKHLGEFSSFDYVDVSGKITSSHQALADFFGWLNDVKPSHDSAVEAFFRYEAIHPHKDGNGRVSEFIAQHMLLRAGLSPILFPNRFDIDYILSLSRNGASRAANQTYVKGLVRDTATFVEGLRHALALQNVKTPTRVRLNPQTGLLNIGVKNGAAIQVRTAFVADKEFTLERETREFVQASELPRDVPHALIQRRQYESYFLFESKPNSAGAACNDLLADLSN